MKQNKSIWLPASLVLAPVALSYFFVAGFPLFTSSGFKWPRISELFMWGLSESAFRDIVIVPVALAIIMLIGMIINIKISGDLKNINKLFLVLLITVAIPILLKNVFSMWAAVSVAVAWLLQRHATKKWLKENS